MRVVLETREGKSSRMLVFSRVGVRTIKKWLCKKEEDSTGDVERERGREKMIHRKKRT